MSRDIHGIKLSARDARILKSIVGDGGYNAKTIDNDSTPSMNADCINIDDERCNELRALETRAVQPLNSTGTPSQSQLKSAIRKLSDIIEQSDHYASAYNNRAQCLRLLYDNDISSPQASASTLWQDICAAINLASVEISEIRTTSQKEVLAAAHTQRGFLLWQLSKKTESQRQETEHFLPSELRGIDSKQLEDMVSREFDEGAKLGNTDAQELAKLTNPYARLCGETVQSMLQRELHSPDATTLSISQHPKA